MPRSLKHIHLFLTAALLIVSCTRVTDSPTSSDIQPVGEQNLAYKWGKISLECTANDTENFQPRPTVTSRILALIWTSVFDAWSRYDANAKPFYLTSVERRPDSEQTLQNKEIAISYAAYRTMLEYYFSDSVLLKNKMIEFGFDPDDNSLDPTTAIGIGNLAAKAVIEGRHDDGSNENGKHNNGRGIRYSDYTGYKPINTADKLTDLARWQPKYFSDGKGGKFAPACLTPHWGKVQPLGLKSGDQFRPAHHRQLDPNNSTTK